MQDDSRCNRGDAAEFMGRGLKLERQIKAVLSELQEAERSNIKGVDYSAILSGRGKSSAASTEAAAIRAAELRERHAELFLKWLRVQCELTDVVGRIRERDPRAALYLTYAYIDGYSMEKIADMMDYSTRRIYQIHHKAMELVRQEMAAGGE